MTSEVMTSVRAIIYVADRDGLVKTICNKTTSKIEEIKEEAIVVHISLSDFQSLRDKKIQVKTIAKIPPKAEKLFNVAPLTVFYEVTIPSIPLNGREEMKSIGCELSERSSYDKEGSPIYLAYLRPDQVENVYNLSFVHSIKCHKPDEQHEWIVEIMKREPVDIFGRYATGTKDSLQAFIQSWCSSVNESLDFYVDDSLWFMIKRITEPVNVKYIDELASLPYVRDVKGSGQPRLCQ